MTTLLPPSKSGSGWLGRAELHWLLYGALTLGFVWAASGGRWGTAPAGAEADQTPPLPSAQHRVNPNIAQWWELAALPGLGESLAKRIVAYREQQQAALSDTRAVVFRTAQDLAGVNGVGPKKAAALDRMLVFPGQPQAADSQAVGKR
jgi:hypothetical protein